MDITYYHQILAAVIASPDRKQVIPLCPEHITKTDGETKMIAKEMRCKDS